MSPDLIADVLAVLAAAALALIAALHVYWAVGGRWPGHDEPSLVHMVVGTSPGDRMPSPSACLVVTALLVLAALAPLGAREFVALPLARLATIGAALVLLLRGLGGFFEHHVRPEIQGRPYARLNRRLYSPLCLALGGALGYVAWHSA